MMDLTELEFEYLRNEQQNKVYMFLSLVWAIIADIDINSEVIRCVGSARFTIWGVYRALNVLTYPGALTYNGFNVENSLQPNRHEANKAEQRVETGFKLLNIQNVPWIAKDVNSTPCSQLNDGQNDIVCMSQDATRVQLVKYLLAMETGDFFNKRSGDMKQNLGLEYIKTDQWKIEPNTRSPVPEGLQY